MTNESRKRIILYSTAVLILAGLAYVGLVYKVDADAATLVGSAEVLAQTGSYDAAMDHSRRALKQEPDNRYAHIIMAHCLGQVGKYDESVDHYRRAVELSDPKDTKTDSLKLYVGEMLIRAGHPDQAAELAEGVLKAGENQGARYVLAAARVAEERYELAAAQYDRCIEIAPEDPEPLIRKASFLERQGHLPESLTVLEQAVLLTPDNPSVLLPRARVLAGLGQEEAAVESLLHSAEAQAKRTGQFLFAEDALVALRTNELLLAACRPPLKTE